MKRMTPEEVADTCEETAALLEGHWGQGDWHYPSFTHKTPDGGRATTVERWCVEGALGAVIGFDLGRNSTIEQTNDFRNCQVYRAIRDTIREEFPGYGEFAHLPSWNDDPNRTEQQVLDILHRTAKRVQGVE